MSEKRPLTVAHFTYLGFCWYIRAMESYGLLQMHPKMQAWPLRADPEEGASQQTAPHNRTATSPKQGAGVAMTALKLNRPVITDKYGY